MEEYISEYGYHMNEKLYMYALSLMRDRVGKKINPWDKERLKNFLRDNNVSLENNYGFDASYAISMAMADYYGSSISDERHLALFVKDFCEDPDGSGTKAFDHFYIDCVAKGIPIYWDEML